MAETTTDEIEEVNDVEEAVSDTITQSEGIARLGEKKAESLYESYGVIVTRGTEVGRTYQKRLEEYDAIKKARRFEIAGAKAAWLDRDTMNEAEWSTMHTLMCVEAGSRLDRARQEFIAAISEVSESLAGLF